MVNGEAPEPLEEQQAFINRAGTSHGLLVAGPGTGKTFTLEQAARHLVEEEEADPDRLVLLTLTRSMSGSLEERVPYGNASTLHAFALRHLNLLGEAGGRRVPDSWETEELIHDDLHLGVEEEFDVAATPGEAKSFLKELARSFRQAQDEPEELSDEHARFYEVFQRQRELFRYRLMDEMVPDLLTLVERGQPLVEPPQYLLVDEYQDLNPGELRLLREIAGRHDCLLLACGDDRQSIYGFREADSFALHRFPDVYELDEVDYLWRSFRCPPAVCRIAEAIARPLPDLPGIDRPALEAMDAGEDGEVVVLNAPSVEGEADWVLEECERLIQEEGYDPRDIMIVAASFRDAVERMLAERWKRREEVSFDLYDPRQQDPVGDEAGVRVLGAALRLAADPADQLAWRTIQWATTGIGEETRRQLLSANEQVHRQNLEAVAERVAACQRTLNAGEAVIERFGGAEEVDAREVMACVEDGLDQQFDREVGLNQLFDEQEEPVALEDWTELIQQLQRKEQIEPSERPDGVPVRTIHGAKGLEAPVVVVMNAIQYSFTGRGDVADGIRQLYVALSRASERLYITAPDFVKYSQIGNAIGTDYAGLADQIERAARRADIPVQRQE